MTSIESIPEKWAAAWSANDSAAFAKLFAPQAMYTDHAHQLITTKLEDHHRVWRNANPNFKVIVDPSTPIWINQVMVYLRSSSAVQSVHPKHVESNPHEVSVGEKSSVVSEDVDDAPIFDLRALTTACE
ncbi:hypothetical protein K4K51_012631 [Colletotrichum sp. SAR 10_75]|nr:hypothetical protein K4K51_012631 [Colletotrichum sp. SAR 10_75]